MEAARIRTVGKTPLMAFVLDYLREFPGAGYERVKAAAQAAGMGIPATIIYGNALRVLKKESERASAPAGTAPPRRSRRRRAPAIEDLAGFVEELEVVVAERDRLRAALDQIRAVVKTLRR
jgi:hypothetical protein